MDAIRYTPAGIPVMGFTLHHVSEQTEAGMQRSVSCQIKVVAMAQQAEALAAVSSGRQIMVSGFLGKRSAKSQLLELHLQAFQLL